MNFLSRRHKTILSSSKTTITNSFFRLINRALSGHEIKKKSFRLLVDNVDNRNTREKIDFDHKFRQYFEMFITS